MSEEIQNFTKDEREWSRKIYGPKGFIYNIPNPILKEEREKTQNPRAMALLQKTDQLRKDLDYIISELHKIAWVN